MVSGASTDRSMPPAAAVTQSVVGGVRWGLDRMLAIGYGVVYDYIFDRFAPYQALKHEIVSIVEGARDPGVARRDVQILDIACGPGNMAVTLADAGFSVVGVDPYGALVELAREKRRAQHLATVAFRHADLATGNTFSAGTFDQIVNVHSLYLHPSPRRLLREACRVLKPGGLAVFVNRTRRVSQWSTVREIARRDGFWAAFASLVWIVPNSIFEAIRQRTGPHYWNEPAFAGALREAGFEVVEIRRTFVNGSSLLAVVRKATET